jgi:hypothetical protein
MNAMMSVSHRLFAAALAENGVGRRVGSRPDKPPVIALARREAGPSPSKQPMIPTAALTPRPVMFDSRLHA